ncbi:MAG: outer membrane beta-barrel protein, partial [Hyphomicrobium sp.]
FKMLGKNHTEHNFDNDVQGTKTFDDFVVSRARSFDYSRSDGQMNLLTFTRSMFQPFAIYDFGHIDFYNQTAGASRDRDATENFGIAGVRFQPHQDFRIDVGYRLNHRAFDDRTVSSFTSDSIDINMFWQPFKDLKLTGVVERYFDESTSSFGLVDDVQTYGTTVDWTLMPRWRLAGTTYFDRETAVGDTIIYKKLTSTLSLTHDINEHLEIFVSGLGKWVKEEASGDSYDRYKIGSGLRYKF